MDSRIRFEALYRAHAGAVRTYAGRRADAQTADDVVADVFLVVWRRLDDVPADPLPWLLAVARRVLANRRRSAARADALRGRLGRAQEAIVDSAGEGDPAVVAVLNRLRDRDRQALLLVGWEGLTPAQAARVLGIKPNTFAARLSRARRRFARAYGIDTDPGRSNDTEASATR